MILDCSPLVYPKRSLPRQAAEAPVFSVAKKMRAREKPQERRSQGTRYVGTPGVPIIAAVRARRDLHAAIANVSVTAVPKYISSGVR